MWDPRPLVHSPLLSPASGRSSRRSRWRYDPGAAPCEPVLGCPSRRRVGGRRRRPVCCCPPGSVLGSPLPAPVASVPLRSVALATAADPGTQRLPLRASSAAPGRPPPLGDDALMATSPAPGALPFPRSRGQSRVSLASRFKLHSSRAELVTSPSPPRGQAPAARLFVLVNCVTVPRFIPPPNSALAFAFFCKSSFNFHRRLLTSL